MTVSETKIGRAQEGRDRIHDAGVLDAPGLDHLLQELAAQGYELLGPTVVDRAIVYDTIDSSDDLPRGWQDEQQPGTYRLRRRTDEAYFGYVVGPQSWKKFLFPPRERLYQVSRNGNEFDTTVDKPRAVKRALIGVRPCELAAIAIQDQVFLGGSYVDPHYNARRKNLFIVAVHCGDPAATCFCTSMHCGPEATSGFDLALTEIIDQGKHEFLVQVGSARGQELFNNVTHRPVTEGDQASHRAIIERSVGRMQRKLATDGLKELLYRNHASPRWDDIAERCLSCANCTLVCPTCFCSTIEDTTDLTGDHAERWREWDSCFNLGHSYIAGGHIRSSTRSRYRQWLTHKLASWQDQFGTSGCVGCGRCITWCPVGIDLTAEVASFEEIEKKKSPAQRRKET